MAQTLATANYDTASKRRSGQMRHESHNLDGRGAKRCQVFDLPPAPRALVETSAIPEEEFYRRPGESGAVYRARVDALQPLVGQAVMREAGPREYWPAVTDVPCPLTGCAGTIRWAEAGYVPGYRICDGCGRHYKAAGTSEAPTLIRVGTRRSVRPAGRAHTADDGTRSRRAFDVADRPHR